jgi:hypothetical protein
VLPSVSAAMAKVKSSVEVAEALLIEILLPVTGTPLSQLLASLHTPVVPVQLSVWAKAAPLETKNASIAIAKRRHFEETQEERGIMEKIPSQDNQIFAVITRTRKRRPSGKGASIRIIAHWLGLSRCRNLR